MDCPTCGSPRGDGDCLTCGTPADGPVVWPDVRTYAVRGLGIATALAVGASVLANLVLGVYPLVGRSMAIEARDLRRPEQLDALVAVQGLLVVPYLVAFLTAAVLVIVWLYRARKNLDAFPGTGSTLAAGWAIGGWFVPFANLVVPCRVMANVARESLFGRRTAPLVVIWWTAFLAQYVVGRVIASRDAAAYAGLPAPSTPAAYERYVEYWGDALVRNAFDMVVLTVAGTALIILVLRISRAQEERIAKGAPGPIMPGMIVSGMTAPPPASTKAPAPTPAQPRLPEGGGAG